MNGNKIKILVVDTDPVVKDLFKGSVDGGVVEVNAVGTATDAIRTTAHEKFDVVFTELALPDLSGMDVLKTIKRSSPDTIVIIMTSNPSVESLADAMRLGAGDALFKPFTSEKIGQTVSGTVETLRRRREAELRETEEKEGFERFSLAERVQHIILIVSFFALVFSGLPLIFPDAAIVQGFFFFQDSSMLRGLTHRVAAVALVALSLFHVGYGIVSAQGRKNLAAIIPRFSDLTDTLKLVQLRLGLGREHPRFDRFNLFEKFEYLAVVWGTLIMILTGLVLWFKEEALSVAPMAVIDVARIIHRYEAILAFLSIVIWHFYNVHLAPGFFPMNKSFLTGRLSRDEMIEHHPIEYERITGRKATGEHH